MKRVTEASVLQEAIGRIKRDDTDFTVSLFASKPKIEAWIAEGALWMSLWQGALLIHRHDGNLVRIYHVAPDQPSLSAVLGRFVESMQDPIIVADLVGRPEDVVRVTHTYQRQGFVTHARLVRMHRTGIQPTIMSAETGVELASSEDVQKLRAFMEHWLDPLSEQIQSIGELREAVASEGVLVVRDGYGLAGILIQETKGQSTVLRYWHVASHHHGKGIGSRLMRAFLARCATSRRIALWVIAGNSDAIAKYRHYGFSEDSIVDNIMVKKPEQITR